MWRRCGRRYTPNIMEGPLISVYIPTNGRPELEYAIDSILNQDIPGVEIVVSSCAKQEEVARLIRRYNNPLIKNAPLPEGMPTNGTFDYAARHTTGRYIFFLSDDDCFLPGALALMVTVARSTGADLVAGNHLYFYDNRHARRYLRHAMGVVPYTGTTRTFNPFQAIRAFFAFDRIGPKHQIPRLHPSTIMVERGVMERAWKQIGTIMFDDLPNGLSHQPILLAHAQRCVSVDYPVVIVGRLGVSMSQVWSTAARNRFRTTPFPLEYSPVIGYTRINGSLENYLRLQKRYPEVFGDIPINYNVFARIYVQELRYLDMEWNMMVPVWRDAFAFLRTLPEPVRTELIAKARRFALLYPVVFVARRTGLHHLWRVLLGRRIAARAPSPAVEFAHKREFYIPLVKYPTVRTISDVAANAFSILRHEIGQGLPPAPSI